MENRFRLTNREAIQDVEKLNEEIEKIKNSDNPDPKKLQELYLRQFYRGLQINNGYTKNYGLNRW